MEKQQQLKPLVVTCAQTMKLLNIGYTTLMHWMALGRLHDLKLHNFKKMFAYSEIEQLAKVPDAKQPTQTT